MALEFSGTGDRIVALNQKHFNMLGIVTKWIQSNMYEIKLDNGTELVLDLDKQEFRVLGRRKGWGTDEFPQSEWIDCSGKTEYTCNGKRVINLEMKLINSVSGTNEEVTFPVKGTIILREKPLRTGTMVWTISGIHSLFDKDGKYNLVKV